jgi:hypothetical protein
MNISNAKCPILENLEALPDKIRFSETYLVFKKIQEDKHNPFYGLRSRELHNALRQMVVDLREFASVEKSFDYGLGGINTILISIPYKNYVWIFGIDILDVILINFFPMGQIHYRNKLAYFIPTLDIVDEISKGTLHNFMHDNHKYFVLNNHFAFESYKKFIGFERETRGKDIYYSMWKDFECYINNGEAKGTHLFIQIGNILILTDFTAGLSEYHKTTSKIQPPNGFDFSNLL